MLRDGLIVFEGDADALRESTDPYMQTFSVVRAERDLRAESSRITYATNTFAGLVGTEDRRADDRRASSSPC